MHENEWLKQIKETSSIIEDNIISMDIILDNKSISHVGIREREIIIYGCRTKIGCIGGVATKPKYRNHGLATRLLESSIRRINEDGGDIMFVSGDRGLYKRLGCVDAGEVQEFIITRSKSAKLGDKNIKLSPFSKNDLIKLVSVYQKEPVRFYRSLENFRYNCQRHPLPLWITPDILLIQKAEKFLGYLVVEDSKKKHGHEPGHGYISEYAGNRKAVVSAISHLFEQYDFNDLTIWAPRHDTELIQILSDRTIKSKKRNLMWHTFKLINFPRLMKRFRPYIEERIGVEVADLIEFNQIDDNFFIKLEDEEFSTDGASMALIVFGSHDCREQELLPKGDGQIAKVLKALFPLPFVWPGLDSF